MVNLKDVLVILDPGHGKSTPGKCSPTWKDGTKLYEWSWTREIANMVKEMLDAEGIPCVLTVTTDADVSLSDRASLANKFPQKHKLLISIHGNASTTSGEGSAKGWEIYTTKGLTQSDALADKFIDNFNYCCKGRKLRGKKENNFTVLVKTKCPCVLTENFFYDNADDCQYMLSDGGKDAIAELHYRAIKSYIATLK